MVEVGFYGKLPSHGDFLRRRVSDAFVRVWDAWLQESMSASQAALGTRWLDTYLTSPVWRFACAGGIVGSDPMIGLMVPSVDRVGRYFHLTIVVNLPQDLDIAFAAATFGDFFEHAQRLVIDTLAADRVDFERFDEEVAALHETIEPLFTRPRTLLDPMAAKILEDGDSAWQIPIGSPSEVSAALEQIFSLNLRRLYDPLVVMWTDGSAAVEPTCLLVRGLPRPEAFAALLDGTWTSTEWQSIAAHLETAALQSEPETLVDDLTPPRYRSAAATDVGRVRGVNQDSLIERTEVGLWAVADGLGGHNDGETASRMVCDALADFTPNASFEQMVETAGDRLHDVNDYLVRSSAGAGNGALSGSTVAALLVRGTRCAILWAGDSRVYRSRDGRLEQLTHDHTLAATKGLAAAPSNVITRAIGGEATLVLDSYRDRVRCGDRFLLCSDGLTKTVPESEIQRWMGEQEIRTAVEGLISATLDAGAPDNVTVVIVEAYS